MGGPILTYKLHGAPGSIPEVAAGHRGGRHRFSHPLELNLELLQTKLIVIVQSHRSRERASETKQPLTDLVAVVVHHGAAVNECILD